MSDWKQLSSKEIEDFFSGVSTKDAYRMQDHSFRVMNRIGKQVCTRCGLLSLNNKITQWAIDKGCNYADHPQYKQKVKTLTRRSWQ